MSSKQCLVLIASASSYERGRIERGLESTGWTLRPVADAEEASGACAANGHAPVLVIDSGLLDSEGDPQWRLLRSSRPELGAVVRCLVSPGETWKTDANTYRVHPSDTDGLCQAISALDGRPPLAASAGY